MIENRRNHRMWQFIRLRMRLQICPLDPSTCQLEKDRGRLEETISIRVLDRFFSSAERKPCELAGKRIDRTSTHFSMVSSLSVH